MADATALAAVKAMNEAEAGARAEAEAKAETRAEAIFIYGFVFAVLANFTIAVEEAGGD